MRLKKFTKKNLRADGACDLGMEFVAPLIKAKKDVALSIYRSKHDERFGWLSWSLDNGYDLRSIGLPGLRQLGEWFGYDSSCNCDSCTTLTKQIASVKKQEAKK